MQKTVIYRIAFIFIVIIWKYGGRQRSRVRKNNPWNSAQKTLAFELGVCFANSTHKSVLNHYVLGGLPQVAQQIIVFAGGYKVLFPM